MSGCAGHSSFHAYGSGCVDMCPQIERVATQLAAAIATLRGQRSVASAGAGAGVGAGAVSAAPAAPVVPTEPTERVYMSDTMLWHANATVLACFDSGTMPESWQRKGYDTVVVTDQTVLHPQVCVCVCVCVCVWGGV